MNRLYIGALPPVSGILYVFAMFSNGIGYNLLFKELFKYGSGIFKTSTDTGHSYKYHFILLYFIKKTLLISGGFLEIV